MTDLSNEERLKLLNDSIIAKINDDPYWFEDIYKQIGDDLIGCLYRWRAISKPKNVITTETSELLEKLEKVIYMTIKNHKKNDKNNGTRQE